MDWTCCCVSCVAVMYTLQVTPAPTGKCTVYGCSCNSSTGAAHIHARCYRAGASAEQTTGRGTGIDDAGLQEKARIVQATVDRARQAHPPPAALQARALPPSDGVVAGADDGDAARVPREFAEAMLEEVGGLELAAIAGAIIAARDVRTPSAHSSTCRYELQCELFRCSSPAEPGLKQDVIPR